MEGWSRVNCWSGLPRSEPKSDLTLDFFKEPDLELDFKKKELEAKVLFKSKEPYNIAIYHFNVYPGDANIDIFLRIAMFK